nr:E3 ubiquitin-protein ligase UPL2-like [Tanacetum cinerariifolium]
STVQSYGGSEFEFVTDYMEHDQDTDGGYAPPSKDDYKHGTSKETMGLDNGDEGDEIDEDEDGDDEHHNDLEEDEDEEDDDGGVILRIQGRTTSIYNLLGRPGDSFVPFQHPLLMGPSSSRVIST